MGFGIMTLISTIGFVQGLFLCLILTPQFNAKATTKYTIGLLLVFNLNLAFCIFYSLNLLESFWILHGLETVSLYLHGPILYLYVKSKYLGAAYKSRPYDVIHFIPAIILFFLFHPLFFRTTFLNFTDNFNYMFPEVLSFYTVSKFVFQLVLSDIHVIFYSVLIFLFLRKKKNNDENYDSISIKQHLKWIKLLVYFFILFAFIGTFDTILNVFFNLDFPSYYSNICLLVILIFIISYISFNNKSIVINPIELIKRRATNLANIDMSKTEQDISSAMKIDHAYKNKELSLKLLAQQLSISTHQLSEYLNSQKSTTFTDYVNSFRISYAKQLLKDVSNNIYTLEGIADQSGFKSLATFHRNFKKHTGLTPKKWMKSQSTDT